MLIVQFFVTQTFNIKDDCHAKDNIMNKTFNICLNNKHVKMNMQKLTVSSIVAKLLIYISIYSKMIHLMHTMRGVEIPVQKLM